jgi:hypothetical protein
MSLHIDRFVDLVRSHDAKGKRDVVLSIQDARNLLGDITKLLNQLNRQNLPKTENQTQVEISGGRFR